MKTRFLLAFGIAVFLLAGCDQVGTWRDSIAVSYGYLTWAQSQYKTQCQAAPTASTCAEITRGIGAHNTAVHALDAYCNGTPAAGQTAWLNGGPCVPIKDLGGALAAAVGALGPITSDLKLLATGKSQPKLTTERILKLPETRASLQGIIFEGGK